MPHFIPDWYKIGIRKVSDYANSPTELPLSPSQSLTAHACALLLPGAVFAYPFESP